MRGTFDLRELADGKTQQVGALRLCAATARGGLGAAAVAWMSYAPYLLTHKPNWPCVANS